MWIGTELNTLPKWKQLYSVLGVLKNIVKFYFYWKENLIATGNKENTNAMRRVHLSSSGTYFFAFHTIVLARSKGMKTSS